MRSEFPRLAGSIPALATPLIDDGLDLFALDRLIAHVAGGGSSAMVVAGSTGEGSSLEIDEYSELMARAAHHVSGLAVIAAVGAASTRKAIHLARIAEAAGAAALLVVTPYYVRPSDEGVYRHVMAIADVCSLPIVLYNVPSRTGYDVPVEIVLGLHRAGAIVGLKECAANLGRVARLLAATGRDFSLFCGDDEVALEMRRAGAVGCISVIANIVPDLCADAHRLWDRGDFGAAAARFAAIAPLTRAVLAETNPQGVKHALARLGLCRADLRLPLLGVGEKTAEAIDGTLAALRAVA